MPRPTDKSEPSTLPDPALNPLLNPLLAAHMGRWAEVYFTNPPEKREQAVSELLRELENGSSATRPFSQSIEDEREVKKAETTVVPDPLPDATELETSCPACGHNNPEAQKFCGMCGAPLQLPQPERLIEIAQSEPIVQASWQEPDPEPSLDTQAVAYASEIEQDDCFRNGGKHSDLLEPARLLPENELPQFARETEPVPYRYRLYIGVVLAILLTVLLFMAWRGTQALSGIQQSPPSRTMPLPQPVAADPPAARNNVVPVEAAPLQKKADKPVQKAEKRENPPEQQLVHSAKPPDATSQKQQAAAGPAPRMVPVAATSPAPAIEQSSAQDLATAERYLNGTQGTNRDSREAVQWLWKAVGKGNPTATIALSDLYLRGVGVTKNCDQARLLLDAAARKGVKAAGDRLRNLQAFGCQ